MDRKPRQARHIASLNDGNLYNYQIEFPVRGHWTEVFNTNVYDDWVNPRVAGNGGERARSSTPRDGPPRRQL